LNLRTIGRGFRERRLYRFAGHRDGGELIHGLLQS
jgi:hypothetical protein